MMKNKKKEDNEIVSGMGGGTWEVKWLSRIIYGIRKQQRKEQ